MKKTYDQNAIGYVSISFFTLNVLKMGREIEKGQRNTLTPYKQNYAKNYLHR